MIMFVQTVALNIYMVGDFRVFYWSIPRLNEQCSCVTNSEVSSFSSLFLSFKSGQYLGEN